MRAAMSRAQQHILEQVEDMPDVEDGGAVFRASLQEREFIAALARATLDGVFTGVPAGSPASLGCWSASRRSWSSEVRTVATMPASSSPALPRRRRAARCSGATSATAPVSRIAPTSRCRRSCSKSSATSRDWPSAPDPGSSSCPGQGFRMRRWRARSSKAAPRSGKPRSMSRKRSCLQSVVRAHRRQVPADTARLRRNDSGGLRVEGQRSHR
jgi:hypothetical protein